MGRAQPLGEAAGRDPQLAELAAGRLVAGEAALAGPAGHAVHDGHARAVLELARDLVPEHGARSGAAELLDVRAAQPAGADAHEQPGPGRLRQLGELWEPVVVEDDRAHRRIVGGARGRTRFRSRRCTGNETRRRVEMPPSSASPDLRARTKTASSCCCGEAGKLRSWCIVIVAQPSGPVGVSGGIENCWNGTAVA